MELTRKVITSDLLIIGGGAAGCFAALRASEDKDINILIAEKGNIKRSGCLAAGVNALNAYIAEGETPESFLNYVRDEFNGVIREDLVYSIAERLNRVTEKVESYGLPILKDKDGKYQTRGKRSIKINGENIKPLLAKEVSKRENITILNGINITDYILKDGKVIGAYGFSVKENIFYIIYSKLTICATGGAAGIYKPNNSGFSRHKMWYSPFNTGAGYAMGIRAGAEMTTFEMRFIALRCKDTIAPTGTIAQGIRTPQVNGSGETYVKKYGEATTINRLYSTLMENELGLGPCYLKTQGISKEQEVDLLKAYLNMAPSQTLKWVENNTSPSTENVEIDGTEPYIVGGHTASGYWVDKDRRTTITGLFSAGDVTGGSPKKYVTGCFAEGEMAAEKALELIKDLNLEVLHEKAIEEKFKEVTRFFKNDESELTIESVESKMQSIMDEYAGGISNYYRYNEEGLTIGKEKISQLWKEINTLKAKDSHELLFIYEIIDRLQVAEVLIEHLKARKETRWRCYEENTDFPNRNDEEWLRYVNSIKRNGKIEMITRNIVGRDEKYEHKNS